MTSGASHKRNLEAYVQQQQQQPAAAAAAAAAASEEHTPAGRFDEAAARRRFADFYRDCVAAVPNSPDVPVHAYRFANEAGEFTRLVTAAEDRYVRMLRAYHGL